MCTYPRPLRPSLAWTLLCHRPWSAPLAWALLCHRPCVERPACALLLLSGFTGHVGWGLLSARARPSRPEHAPAPVRAPVLPHLSTLTPGACSRCPHTCPHIHTPGFPRGTYALRVRALLRVRAPAARACTTARTHTAARTYTPARAGSSAHEGRGARKGTGTPGRGAGGGGIASAQHAPRSMLLNTPAVLRS